MPVAMRPKVPIEQGIMIMVSYCPEPDAKGADKILACIKCYPEILIALITQFGFPNLFGIIRHHYRQFLPLIFNGSKVFLIIFLHIQNHWHR